MNRIVSTETEQKTTRLDRKMIFLVSAVYLAEYFGRCDFAASLIEMIGEFGADARAVLGLSLTLMSISYGFGQIVTGIVGDRIPPRFVVFAGLIGAGACNFAVGFATNLTFIAVAWFLNGVCKSMIWPSLCRQMSCDMSERGFQTGVLWVSISGNVGTVLVYLAIVPISILLYSWRLSFWFGGFAEAAAGVVWVLSVRTLPSGRTPKRDLPVETENPPKSKRPSPFPVLMAAGIPVLYIAVVCHGLLRDGVTSWMPTLVSETYDLGSVTSIMSSAILPVFSTVCVILAGMVFMKLKNELVSAAIFFSVVVVSLGCLTFAMGKSAPLTVVLLALAMSGVQGVNHILTTRVPHRFGYAGMVSTMAGLMNSATYVGAAISGYGIALYSEAKGWGATVVAWLTVAAVGTLLLVFCFRRWKRFINAR